MLGVSASIAAYKGADLCSRLVRAGADVRVLMTPNAAKMVGPPTFEGLTHRPAAVDLFQPDDTWEAVLERVAHPADLYVIAPCSADCLARIAAGMADDFVVAAALAATCPVLIAPAMASSMWHSPRTQRNAQRLRDDGFHFIGPDEGRLASGRTGAGRMAEPDVIFQAALALLDVERTPLPPPAGGGQRGAPAPATSKPSVADSPAPALSSSASAKSAPSGSGPLHSSLITHHFLVTAGPTQEALDPVRMLTNRSTGKMGIAVAEAAARRGAQVTLVLGPTPLPDPPGVTTVRVTTAQEMRDAAMAHFQEAEIVVAAAAVSDYRPAAPSAQKMKKGAGPETLVLERTPDILAEMGRNKRPGQTLVGFAAETENLLGNARAKRERKNLDAVVANDVTREGAGFGADTNAATWVTRDAAEEWPTMPKAEMAERIVEAALALRERE